jgi:hypothetical protein
MILMVTIESDSLRLSVLQCTDPCCTGTCVCMFVRVYHGTVLIQYTCTDPTICAAPVPVMFTVGISVSFLTQCKVGSASRRLTPSENKI